MSLRRQEWHECPIIQQDPPDPDESWEYVCEECGSRFHWSAPSRWTERRTERYGFLGLRSRQVDVPAGDRGWWLALERAYRYVDTDGTATDWVLADG
jgi:hypothetical protein